MLGLILALKSKTTAQVWDGAVWCTNISEIIKCQVQSMSRCMNRTTVPVMKLKKVLLP